MDTRNETVQMLIRFYNVQAGTAFRFGNPKSQEKVAAALDRSNNNVTALKNHIRTWVRENPEAAKSDKDSNHGLWNCFEAFGADVTTEVPAAPVAPVAPTPQAASGMLEQVMTAFIANMQMDKVEAEIVKRAEQSIKDFIQREYGTITRNIVTVVDGKHASVQGIQHEKFERVLMYVANNKPVFLIGPAGSGKNVLCKQIAEALGLKFYFTNAVTQEYQLKGFTDAMGNYQPTQFYKAFTEGGLFMLDEMDASIPEVLVILNAAIANRYFDFPAPIGMVEAHPDFRVIAAGNTFGQGASYEYVGRNQLDAASLNRFAVEKIDYSEAIENSVAGDIELANFCRAFRKTALKAGQQVVVSYRNIEMIATMSKVLKLDEVLEDCLVKGMEKDDLNIIIRDIGMTGKYVDALKQIAGRM